MSRILFLYATNHSGHRKAAEAIEESLRRIAPSIVTSEIDFFTHSYPNLGPFIFKMYVEILRHIPHTYDYLYGNQNLAEMTAELRQFFRLVNLPKLHKVLKDHRPDLIVCTQAIPAGFIAVEKDRGTLSTPLMATITDFVANPYWPDRHVDCYFVPSDEIKQQLLDRNISPNNIEVTGIPVNASFHHCTPKKEMKRRLGLSPRLPTALIMGGSQGLGQIYQAAERLSRLPLQMIIVTGYNRSLYRALKKRYREKGKLIFSVARNISSLMDASDLFVGKPGGMTTAEAMSKGLPMVVLSPLPGQEERNATFIVNNNIGERCDTLESLPVTVERLISRPKMLGRFSEQALKFSRPYASDDIARRIVNYLN